MGTVTFDGNKFHVIGKVKRRPDPGFPAVQAATGLRQPTDLSLVQQATLTGPLGIGKRQGNDPTRVWASRNVNTVEEGQITRGPQKQSVTIPSGTIAYNRFQHAFSDLYAMSRRTTLVSGGQTGTKFYFHAAPDDRGLDWQVLEGSISLGFKGTRTMNLTKGTMQTSDERDLGEASATGQPYSRWLSPPLASQTISAQNWTLNIARSTNYIDRTLEWQLRLYAFRPSTRHLVDYIIGNSTSAIKYSSDSKPTAVDAKQSFQDGAFSGSAITVQDGDILVCEIYARLVSGPGTVETKLYYDGSTETTTDNTTVSDHASFLQSANALTLSGAAPDKVAGRLVRFDAATDAFSDTTVDTDTDLNYCQAVVQASERFLALSAFVFGGSGGQNFNAMVQSWDGATWEATGLKVQNNFLFLDMALVGRDVYLLYVNDVRYPAWWRLAILSGGNFHSLTDKYTVASAELPRSLATYLTPSGNETPWVAAADGLYMQNRKVADWDNEHATTTGRLKRFMIDGQDVLVWTDGRQLFYGFWDSAGAFERRSLSPPQLPEAQQGNIQDFTYTDEREWTVAAVGGEDASHNASAFVRTHDNRLWHVPYSNATTDRKVLACTLSKENDGRSRLMLSEENGVANDCDVFRFDHFLENPLEVTGYAYSASGTITDSERNMGFGGLLQKGFLPIQIDADDLDTQSNDTQKVSIKDGQDGTAPANSQTIYSDTPSPQQVWPDKTDGSEGVGVGAKRQQIEITLAGTAGATVGPTVKSVGIMYNIKPMKADGTPPDICTFTVSREPKHLERLQTTPEKVLSNLRTTYGKQELVTLAYTEGSTAVSVNGLLMPFETEESPRDDGDQGAVADTSPITLQVRAVV